jgi:hypothetical protein
MNIISTQAQHALLAGQLKRKALKLRAKQAASKSIDSEYPHTYISSAPGLGKTFEVTRSLKEANIPYITVSGNQSLFAFGVSLAVLAHKCKNSSKIVVVVDDCEEILRDAQSINIMKNVLSGAKEFKYNVSLRNMLNSLTDIQREAIESFTSDDSLGYTVPTDNFVFIFTSNIPLPTDNNVKEAREKYPTGRKVNLLSHLNAIRSRCTVIDFNMNSNEHWGWIADCIMNEDVIDTTDEQKLIVLNWMYDNWECLCERSIRTVQKMYQTMKEQPNDYLDYWEIDYIECK